MMRDIITSISASSWDNNYLPQLQKAAIHDVEKGKLLLFPKLNFILHPEEEFCLTDNITDGKAKNISYNSVTQKVRGASCAQKEYQQLQFMMERFSHSAQTLVKNLFPHYQNNITVGRTSLRTVEILGRKMSPKKDDTRLHVDAFPSTPMQGRRILRVFTNINPTGKPRVWNVGESFETVANRFLPNINPMKAGSAFLMKALKITKGYRTAYDHYMLNIHDTMKLDDRYQSQVSKTRLELLPGSTWIVYTDLVSHAALSGQHLLEQTFYLPPTAMFHKDSAPLHILQSILQKPLLSHSAGTQ